MSAKAEKVVGHGGADGPGEEQESESVVSARPVDGHAGRGKGNRAARAGQL